MSAPIPPPDGLGPVGLQHWETTTADFELQAGEQHLLEKLCRTLDRLDALRRIIERDELVGKDGNVNQAVKEERMLGDSLIRLQNALHRSDAGVPKQARRKYGSQNWRGPLRAAQ